MSTKVNVALRYVGTSAATVVTLLGVVGNLDPDSAQSAMAAIHQMMDGINQATLGAGKLFLIIGPVVGTLLATFGVKSSGIAAAIAFVKSKMVDEAAEPTSTLKPATVEMTAAVAASPIVVGTPVVSPSAVPPVVKPS